MLYYDGDIRLIIIYCRFQDNDNCDVINSTFHENIAGEDGGAMFL